MKLAFYKYEYGNFKDWLIAKITQSKYSHIELVFNDGLSISSSPRDKGVRFKKIDFDYKWYLIEIDKTPIPKLLKQEHLKQGYDWVGLFFHWLGIKSYKKFICSDFIHFILEGTNEFKTPQDIYDTYKG